MAVVQISRVQLRKGLQQDLPALASAEMGWSIDTRRLYIGNGTIAEGAPVQGVTEILTQYSDILNISNNYTFKGTQSGYTSLTGATSLTPTQRTQQQKLDDIINVRDFGAVGNGVTDDTAALQRAIDQVYFGNFAITTPRLRREIHIPAGQYLITSPLYLPSYAILVGEGKQRTVILQTGNSPVIMLKDTSGGTGSSYGSGGNSTKATYITLRDLSLTSTVLAQNVVTLDTASYIEFTRVQFIGATTNSTSASRTAQAGLFAAPHNAAIGDINDVWVSDCDFKNLDQGIIENTYNMRVIGCTFAGMSHGIVLNATATTATSENLKIIGCTFDSIAHEGILVTGATAQDNTTVMSNMNYFGDVGNNYLGAGTGNPAYPCIAFTGANNYSVSDYFDRPDNENFVQPRIKFQLYGTPQVGLDSQGGLTLGSLQQGTGQLVQLSSNRTNANTGIVLAGSYGAFRVHYWLQNPLQTAYRTGFIDVTINGSNVQYVDEYVEYPNASNFTYPGPTGITFSVLNAGSSVANISYTSTSTGSGNLTYAITSLRQ